MITPQGDLLHDPRLTDHGIGPLAHIIPRGNKAPYGIRPALLDLMTSSELLRAQMLMIAEELNVAWDAHEITSEFFDLVLDFFLVPGTRKQK